MILSERKKNILISLVNIFHQNLYQELVESTKIYENTYFHRTLRGHSSVMPASLEVLRHAIAIYSPRSRDWRGSKPGRTPGSDLKSTDKVTMFREFRFLQNPRCAPAYRSQGVVNDVTRVTVGALSHDVFELHGSNNSANRSRCILCSNTLPSQGSTHIDRQGVVNDVTRAT